MGQAIAKATKTFSKNHQSIDLGRRALLVVAVSIAFLSSLTGEYAILSRQITGAGCWLIHSGLLVEVVTAPFLLFGRRRNIKALAVFVVLYFGCYLSAGVVVSAWTATRNVDVFIYLLLFFPLLVLNRLVQETKATRYLERGIRAAPVLLLLSVFPRLAHVLSPRMFGVLPVYLLSYVLCAAALRMVTRYREAYLAELAHLRAVQAEQEAFEWASMQDALTGLPNRAYLQQVVQETLGSASGAGQSGALILMSVSGIRDLNRVLGNVAGDALLLQISSRLRACRPEDSSLGRWGGTEFAVFLGNCGDDKERTLRRIQKFIEQLTRGLDNTRPSPHRDFSSYLRIGVAEYSAGVAAHQLISRAEVALSEARLKKLTTPVYFAREMQHELEERVALEADLRLAQDKGQLQLVYQPQVYKDGRVVGAEALIRWNHPVRGMVSPLVFIPLAEETGLILPIGKWVLTEACRQAAVWAGRPNLDDVVISVNVSPRQLLDQNFVATVLSTLEETGARADRLKLELTESSMLADLDASIAKMQELRAHHVGLSMDDFGTGYSCLAHLQSLPLDAMKIDRSFVAEMTSDPRCLSIVHTVTDLAKRLKLSLVAEGLETLEQLEILQKLGCDVYQGYFHSRPVPPNAFEEFVEAREAARRAEFSLAAPLPNTERVPDAMKHQKPEDESGRLAALMRYNILDSPKEASFDRIAALAKTVFNVPMCAISFIDAERQWLKASEGVGVCESPRGASFCTHTILGRKAMYIADSLLDPRFADHEAVVGPPFVRSYLGSPLTTPDGHNIGALCVIDTIPRQYSIEQIDILDHLAALVMEHLELRRVALIDIPAGALGSLGVPPTLPVI